MADIGKCLKNASFWVIKSKFRALSAPRLPSEEKEENCITNGGMGLKNDIFGL